MSMLDLIRTAIGRPLPQAATPEVLHTWSNEDSSWHSSSLELARGLKVIEHGGAPPMVFADSPLPSAQGMIGAGQGNAARV